VGSGTFDWDLSEPLEVRRAFIFNMAPLEALNDWSKVNKLNRIYQDVVVPSIQTGFLPVKVSANLPAQIVGVMIGVIIRAPPNLSNRPQALYEFIELKPHEYSARVILRFSPAERPEYSLQTYAVIKDVGGLRELYRPEISLSGEYIELSPDDFPIDFVMVKASRDLLQISVLRGLSKWSASGTTIEQSFDLSLDSPSVAIAIPKGIEDVLIEVEALPVDGSRSLKIGPIRTKTLNIKSYSFPEYGPHRIVIECIFSGDVNLFAIDLLPEDAPESEASFLYFTPNKSKRDWGWVADSPFHSGYRYREHRNLDQAQATWSEIKSAFENLVIEAKSGDVT
jgi:plasmid stabilization system protein ParE